MRPIKVLYYEQPLRGPGGSRVSLRNLLHGLGDGVRAHVVGNLPEEIVRTLPPTAVVIPPPRLRPAVRDGRFGRVGRTLRWWAYFVGTGLWLAARILRHGIEVVHGNNEVKSNAPAILAAMLTGRPCVCHLRGTERPRRETQWLFKYVHCYIPISAHVRDYFAHRGLLEGRRVVVIYNSVDVRGLARRSADRLPCPRFRAGWLGRLAWDKGMENFLRVAREVRRRAADVEFSVHGPVPEPGDAGRPYYDTLTALAGELGVEDAVRFAGGYEDVAEVMPRLDVVLCTSSSDNFSRIIYEAMACGVPVVAFDVGGTSEVVRSGVNGLLAAKDDAGAMAEAVLRLRHDAALREGIIRAGRDTASRLFDAGRNARAVLDVYREVLKNHV